MIAHAAWPTSPLHIHRSFNSNTSRSSQSPQEVLPTNSSPTTLASQPSPQIGCYPEGVLRDFWEVMGQNESPIVCEDGLCFQPLLGEEMKRKQPRLVELSYICKQISYEEARVYQILTKITFCPAVFHPKLNCKNSKQCILSRLSKYSNVIFSLFL